MSKKVSPKKGEKKSNTNKFKLLNYQHPDLFGDWLGYVITRIDREKFVAEGTLEIRKDHLSPAGRVHGGVISAFFDFACGAAVFSTLKPKDFSSTVELKVNYFCPIELGDELKVITRVIFRGKRLCVIHGFMYRNGHKKPVAMATATFNVVSGS